ncbi:UvrD-helicase domain-containing protein [Paenibacillus sp. N3/727]|uniref:HelD family protein n=1 Tax=Paenibacillus sp. N3/727 TaxID=2925845 RepID=UPI001F52ECA6|nr:UvrD-helicase domain-containing protein [Paenibacillus sp. N3/727]UNK19889.1 UvrD-helicase domain-containing protein [Paenibacillus sp. N3/727]
MTDSFQSAYQEEELILNEAIAEIDKQLERLQSIPVYTGHDFTEQVLEAGREDRRQSLKKSQPEPYFGRLDFQENGKEEQAPLYIGKVGFDREEASEHPMVIDWRAPVASLFYSFTGGSDPASYEAPEGLVEGLVYLKRNVVIRKQILERVSDTYNRESGGPAVSDEFLVYRLGENKDNRLRDIVSTIQAEQDKIIRAAKNTALIIQGVAGSGKTTVALHRLAFLLYQYKEQVSAEKMIIFAPNHMFLDYISDVLPELGVGDIQQRTFADWASELLDVSMTPSDASETLAFWFETEMGQGTPDINDDVRGRYKGSLRLMNLIERCVEQLEQSALPEGDFSPWDGAVLRRETIAEWFNEEYKPYPLAKRKERVLARLHRWVEMELKKSPSQAVMKERKKKAAGREKSYGSKWPKFEPLVLYKQLFGAAKINGLWSEEFESEIPREVLNSTRKDLKKNVVREEDLTPLLYFHCLMNEITGEQRFDHIVIDEAQDFSPFQVALLDRFVRGHSFTILGDLSQGIHAYRGVHAWEEMSTLFEPESRAYFALTRSYRSTMEIIEFANGILEKGVGSDLLAVPVFRSGDAVRLVRYNGAADREKDLRRALRHLLSKGNYRTVSILTRTLREAKELHELLAAEWPELHLIDGSKQTYQGGISVLPVYLSKGLEFDAVIVADADSAHYAEKAWDAKLMYVGCTRALHELWLLHGEQLPSYVVPEQPEIASQGWPDGV